jgi:hypothetical protein
MLLLAAIMVVTTADILVRTHSDGAKVHAKRQRGYPAWLGMLIGK